MTEEETVPLNHSEEDETKVLRPHSLTASQSALKLKLFELLKSADIEDDDIKEYTPRDASEVFTPSNATTIVYPDHDDESKALNIINSHYDKQILLEEAEMIHKLHSWIEKKGKPAIKKSNELQLKCDKYEQEIRSINLELSTINDELNKTNKEKNELLSKYNNLNSHLSDLQQTIKTLEHHGKHTEKIQSALHDHHEQQFEEIKDSELKINELKQIISSLETENKNYQQLNIQYEEQHNVLTLKLQTKDHQIEELTTDRDSWEAKYDQTNQDLLV